MQRAFGFDPVALPVRELTQPDARRLRVRKAGKPESSARRASSNRAAASSAEPRNKWA